MAQLRGLCGTSVILDDGGHPSGDRGRSNPPDAHVKVVAEASNDDGIVATSNATPAASEYTPGQPASVEAEAAAEAAVAAQLQASAENHEKGSSEGSGPGLGSGDVKDSVAEQSWTATMSTANVSTAEQVELGQFNERVASVASAIDESSREGPREDTSSSMSGRGSRGGIGLGEAVMEAAQNLAHHR